MKYDQAIEPDISKLTGIKRSGFSEASNKRLLRLDPCSYCGAHPPVDIGWEIDHIEPRSAGGLNRWSNYTSACSWCNALKLDRPLLEFLPVLNFELPALAAEIEAELRAAR